MNRIAALLLSLLGVSCAWSGSVLVEKTIGVRIPRPPTAHRTEDGVVRAENPLLAAESLRVLREMRPRVQALYSSEGALPEIWVLDRDPGLGSGAAYVKGDRRNFIVVGPIEIADLEHVLTHELAHWYSHATGVALPVVIEEGVADLVMVALVPAWAESTRWVRTAQFEPAVWTPESALQLTWEDWVRLSVWEELEPRAVGYAIAQRIGIAGIAALREEARAAGLDQVPVQWFLGSEPH